MTTDTSFLDKKPAKVKSYIFLLACLSIVQPSFSQTNEIVWQWTEQIGGAGYDVSSGIVIDNENTIYITGSYTNQMNDNKKSLSSAGKYDLFVAAYDRGGKKKWIWTAGGEKSDQISALTLLSDNTLAVAGTLSPATALGNKKSNEGENQLFISRLDEKGKPDWLTTISYTNSASLYLLDSDEKGNLFACGTFSDSLNVGGKFLISHGKRDIFLLSLSENGGIIELKSIGSKSDEMPCAMAIDTSGNVILGGSHSSNILIDSLQLKARHSEISKNIFLVKLSPDLKVLDSKDFSSDYYIGLKALKVDRLNRLYMTGAFVSQLTVDGNILESKGLADVYLAQFLPDGKISWLKQFGSKKMDYAGGLTIDKLNGAILTGALNDTLESDSITVYFNGAYSNAFVAQFSDEGKTLWAEQIPSKGNSASHNIAVDSDGNLFISGQFSKSLENSTSELISFGHEDVFIAKFHNCVREEKAIEGNDVLCPGSELTLSTRIKYREIAWNDTIVDTKSISVDQPGEYWVQIIDEKGCTLKDTVEVFLAEQPEPELGNDTIIDVNESIELNPKGNYVQYLWQDNSVDSIFLAEATGKKPAIEEYHVMVADSNACIGIDTIKITFIDMYPWLKLNENSQIVVFPNPVKDILNWYLEVEDAGRIEIDITNASGKVFYKETVYEYLPGQTMQIDMQNYEPGVYFLGVTDNQVRMHVPVTHE